MLLGGPTDPGCEFFEVVGPPGANLAACQFVLVDPFGVVTHIVPFANQYVPTDGVWVAASPLAQQKFNLNPNVILPNGIFPQTTYTYLLIDKFTRNIGDDIDVNNDGVIDSVFWSRLVDQMAFRSDSTGFTYAQPTFDPIQSLLPLGALRCEHDPSVWLPIAPDAPLSTWSPGIPNPSLAGCLPPPLSDPIFIPPFADAYVNNATANADENLGSSNKMFVRNKPNSWGFESYLKFKIPKLEGAQKALLKVYGFNPNNSRVVSVAVYDTDSTWEESTITFNNAPGKKGFPVDVVDIDDSGAYYVWDVTALVNQQILDGARCISLMLVSTTEGGPYDRIQFFTKENSENSPELEIVPGKGNPPVPKDKILTAIADADVNSASSKADENTGTLTKMYARNKPGSWAYESYIKFALSDLSAVNKATLKVYGLNPNNSNLVQIAVFKTDTSWKELEITYNNAPGREGLALDVVPIADSAGYYLWDVTPLVNQQIADGGDCVSLVLASINTDSNYDRVKFNTKEDGEHPPLLHLSPSDSIPDICIPALATPTADATVNNANSEKDKNLGSKTYLFARNKPSGYGYESYLSFDVSEFSSMDQVKLRLYGKNNDNNEGLNIGVYPTSDSWTENGITYASSPGASGNLLDSKLVNGNQQYYEFDVTNEVLGEAAGDGIASFFVVSLSTSSKRAKFNSRESNSNPPELVGVCGTDPQIVFDVNDIEDELKEPSDIQLKLYPNPSAGTTQVSLNSFSKGKFNLSIIDMNGKLLFERVYEKEEDEWTISVPTERFSPGMYIIQVQMDQLMMWEKLIRSK